MRQMVLGAVIAFVLTVIVISFLSPKAEQPSTAPDAGSKPVAVVGVADAGLAPLRTMLAPKSGLFKGAPVVNNRLEHQEQFYGPPPQVHGIVTDAGT